MNLDERVSLAKKNIIMIKKIMREYNSTADRAIKDFNSDYRLNLWAGNQRRFIVTGVLSDEEVEVYREQNFDFGIRPLKWDEWFMLIKEYCEIHGVNEVPTHTFSEEGYALDVWFNRQLRNRRKLTPDQFERIESIKPSERKAYIIKFNGKIFHSAKEFSSFINIPYNIVCNCASIGMSGEEMIVFCKTILLGEKIVFKGREFENLRDFSDYYSVPIYKWLTELQEFAIVQNPEGNSKKELIAQKVRPKRSFSYNGQEFNNSKEFAEEFGIPYHFVRACFQEGMTGEEVIKQYWEKEFENAFKRYFKPGRKILYEGQLFVNTRVFADYYGISFNSASTYFRLGYTPQEVIEKCKQGRTREQVEGTHVVFKEKEYISIRQFAYENHLDYAYTQALLREGYTPEETAKIQYGELIVEKEKKQAQVEGTHVVFEGKEYISIRQFVDENGLDYAYTMALRKDGYTPEEIIEIHRGELIVEKEKKQAQVEGAHVVFEGKEYVSIRQFVDENGLDYTYTMALRKDGYTPEEIIKIHRGELIVEEEKDYKFYYKEEGFSSYREFAELYSIPYNRLRLLLKEGFNLDQILEINERGFRRGLKKNLVLDYNGHIYFDVYDFATHYGIDYLYAAIRLRSGWSCDELLGLEHHKEEKKTKKKKRVVISSKIIHKWEASNNTDDQVLLAHAYYVGRCVENDYKKAIDILERICNYSPAKLLLARCYLHKHDRKVKDVNKAIRLIYEYNYENLEYNCSGNNEPANLIESIIPDLAEAFSIVLLDNKENTTILESVKFFAEALGDITALCCLYEYYSDVSNFYYDIETAKEYEYMIANPEVIDSIHEKNPFCIRTSILKENEDYERLLLLNAYPCGIKDLNKKKLNRVIRRTEKECFGIDNDWRFADIAPDTYIEEQFSSEISEILVSEY